MAIKIEMLITAVLLAWCFLGCAHGPGPGTRRLYDGPGESLEGLDAAVLGGRTIVIDPGHGGVFRGARGAAGLDEADANLGVALHLARLLRQAGAEVTLTRETDCDFVDGDSLRLRDDLKARVAISNRIDPDLLISLHHNADLKFDPSFNEIQVYYKLEDDGPSLDAARAIAGRLLRNLGEDKCRVIGGNYHVLRNSVAPAVLCEPSFITNPEVESKLKSDKKQMLEAKAYSLALVDYFSGGVPRIVQLEPSGAILEAWPTVWITFDSRSVIDAASVDVTLDGGRLDARRLGRNFFLARPPAPLAGGGHTLAARARGIGGNASRKASVEFEVRLRPAMITLKAEPPLGLDANPRKITALVLDANGNAVADSTRVVFTWRGGSAERATILGAAAVFTGRDLPASEEVTAECGGLKAVLDPAGAPATTAQAGWVTGFISDAQGRPLANALVGQLGDLGPVLDPVAVRTSTTSDADGFFALFCGGPPAAFEVSKPGYRTAVLDLSAGAPVTVSLERFYSGLDPAAVVMIDAAGGAAASERTGPEGLETSSVNLAVASRLKSLLESVGVRAVLTRETEDNVSGEERVRRAEAARPSLLVSISHADGAGSVEALVSHYPGSAGGARLSRLIGEEIRACLGLEARAGETADYIIQQPSCIAVRVGFPATDAVTVRLRAYSLMCGVLRFLGLDEAETFSVRGLVTAEGSRCPGALVAIDGTLEIVADDRGEFALRLLEPRPHTAEVLGLSGAVRAKVRGVGERGNLLVFDQGTGALTLEVWRE